MKLASEHSLIGPRVLLTTLVAGLLVIVSASTPGQDVARVEVVRGHDAATGEVIVKFRESVKHGDLTKIAREVGAERHEPIGGAGAHVFRSRRLKAADLLAQLSSRADVAYVEPNYIVRAIQTPTDPQFPNLWGLHNIGQSVNGGLPGTSGADIHAVSAWQISTGSAANVVAVIDTGIDYTHPDLAANVWSAPASFTVTIGGRAITCPAGSHGFDAMTKTCDPMDDHDHGSHVSGTIGAVGNNGMGVVGVNWTAAIMGGRFIDAGGSGTIADAIDAIEFVIQAKAALAPTGAANVRVLSASWGTDGFSQALLDEISRANENDMLLVAAAGNDGIDNDVYPFYPASFSAPNVLAVAATDNTDALAYFSNYGATTVDLAAPGVDILSTTVGNTYRFFDGTSMATPHVSGAAALVLSKCSLDTASLKSDILDNVDPVGTLSGVTVTGGRLNVDKAIRACSALPAVPDGLVATPGNARVSLTWQAASGATTYKVKRGMTEGGPYSTLASVKTTSYVDTGVVNDTTYYYVVSAVNLVGESGNSGEVAATPRVLPDFVVSALTVPAASGAGAAVAVTDTTRNQSAGAASASTTRFYLSANAVLDAADTLLDGSRAVPALAGGTSNSGSTSLTIPAGTTAGAYYIIARADADNVVPETQEGNNTAARPIQIGPDLAVSALSVPTAAGAGGVIAVTDTTKNQGAGFAGASTTRFYLSTNTALDALDTLLDGSRAVPSLLAGASSVGSTSLTIPTGTATGNYYIIAKADASNVVPETQEGNNTLARTVQIGPDLVVSALTVPTATSAGSVITVTDTARNQGGGLSGPSTMRFYLSANAVLDAADAALDGSRVVSALAAGASNSGSTALDIPAGTATGSYYIIAKADGDSLVAETQEGNNTAARPIQIGPDLVVSALTVPTAAGAGSVITVTDTTKNQSAGSADASTTRFYLSTNTVLDAADTQLDGRRVVPALPAGGSSAGSTPLTIPAGTTTGNYYIIAKADADNAVPESQEGNNTAARSVQIGPDLIISALTVPTNAAAGTVVTVADTAKNQGAGSADTSTARFYLSKNMVLDAADTLLEGSRAVPPLLAGESSSGSTSLTIPAGTAAGTYYIIAKADADGVVPESQEGNNTAARPIQISVGG